MDTVRDQSDLALLPSPCFVQTSPYWVRCFAVGILAAGTLLGIMLFAAGFSRAGGPVHMIGGVVAAAVCLLVLVRGRPHDWRVWINIAATREGLYLVARRRRVISVPWPNVLGMRVKTIATAKGIRDFLLLTLRLPEDDWAAFGKLSSITGTGAVRDFLVTAIGTPGKDLLTGLETLRPPAA